MENCLSFSLSNCFSLPILALFQPLFFRQQVPCFRSLPDLMKLFRCVTRGISMLSKVFLTYSFMLTGVHKQSVITFFLFLQRIYEDNHKENLTGLVAGSVLEQYGVRSCGNRQIIYFCRYSSSSRLCFPFIQYDHNVTLLFLLEQIEFLIESLPSFVLEAFVGAFRRSPLWIDIYVINRKG